MNLIHTQRKTQKKIIYIYNLKLKDPCWRKQRDRNHTNPKGNETDGRCLLTIIFYFAHDGPTVQNKNKNKFLEPTHLWIKRHGALLLWAQRTQSQPQCTLSGENNSKGRGQGGVYASNLMYAQRMRMVIKLKQNYNTTKLRVFNDT